MWARLEHPKNNFHVIPANDLRDHEQIGCWCKPRIEELENGGRMISHNAADLREFFENDDQNKQGH